MNRVCPKLRLVCAAALVTLGAHSLQACSDRDSLSLSDLQGGWWMDCDAPAVEFFIKGDQYSGDFDGIFKIELDGRVLVFKNGLIDGHSTDVTGRPARFEVLQAVEGRLVLRAVPSPSSEVSGQQAEGIEPPDSWVLRACPQ